MEYSQSTVSCAGAARRTSGPGGLGTVLLLVVGLLAACGGDVGSGGSGATVGFGEGTVTGLGSVVVDGVRFDTTNAAVLKEQSPGVEVPAEAKLGHHVEVDFQSEGVAQAVHIEPQVVGLVTAVASDAITVLGQTVRANTDPLKGPVTVFDGGYTQLTDVAAGDAVEIHGLTTPDASGAFFVQASRIEKLSSAPAQAQLTGVVTGLTSSGAVQFFRIGGLQVLVSGGVRGVPSAAALTNGQTVEVFGTLTGGSAQTVQLAATFVTVKQRKNSGIEAYFAGTLAGLDAVAQSFEVNGVTVHFDSSTRIDPSGTALADGQYVQLRGNFAADGSLSATSVKVRNPEVEGEIEISGTISAFDAQTGVASVRDVTIATAQATFDGCPGTGLAAGLFVEVTAHQVQDEVVAQRVECKSEEPEGAEVERQGVALGVDTAALTFTLNTSAGAVPVRWQASTLFRDLASPAAMAGQTVEVDGVVVQGVLVASRIRLRSEGDD